MHQAGRGSLTERERHLESGEGGERRKRWIGYGSENEHDDVWV